MPIDDDDTSCNICGRILQQNSNETKQRHTREERKKEVFCSRARHKENELKQQAKRLNTETRQEAQAAIV